MSNNPEEVSEFSYETFEIEAESVDSEDSGSAFVQTEWIVEFVDTGDIEAFVNTIEDENR